MVASRACAKMFCRAVARGPGESAIGGARAGDGERSLALPFGCSSTAAGIVVRLWARLYWRWESNGRAWALVYGSSAYIWVAQVGSAGSWRDPAGAALKPQPSWGKLDTNVKPNLHPFLCRCESSAVHTTPP